MAKSWKTTLAPARPAHTASALRRALGHASDGVALDAMEAEALLHARGADLNRLLDVASRVRDAGLGSAGRPGVITYSRKVFIPLTYLCRDRCHYCTFVQTPGQLAKAGQAPFLSPDTVLEIARQGAALGCKEALFTLGDRPESRWRVAREWLDARGYDSTIDYMRAMAIRVLEETGLLPHLNPGVMSWAELQRLKPVAPSMGMMLETTATRLWSEKGGPHYGSPDKDPAVRLRVLDDAGRSNVPFTTGVLLGIGESYADRIDAMFAIRAAGRLHGHVQEVIVQNFRAKDSTAMMRVSDLETQEYAAAIAVTRLVLGEEARIQAPPNLTDASELALLVRAGVDDWGGVSPLTPDYVNPERPWPQIDELARLTAVSGFALRERLTVHPSYIRAGEPWLDPHVVPYVHALADPATGLARQEARPSGRPWKDAGTRPGAPTRSIRNGTHSEVDRLLRKAETNPAGLNDDAYATLLSATGADLDALAAVADGVRRDAVGEVVTYAVNRNLDSSLLSAPDAGLAGSMHTGGPRHVSLTQFGDLVDEAWLLGATEICMQGAIPPTLSATGYLDLAKTVKERCPDIHLHAFRPIEIADGAARSGMSYREFLEALHDAGVDTVPGTGARILDDAVRRTLTGGTCLPVDDWLRIITTAHRVGLRSTATMIYGHIETPAHQVAHLRTLMRVQDQTGGFSEFIPMPFVPSGSPAHLSAVKGPTLDQTRAVHAVARLMLSGAIDHIQAAWTKLGMRRSQVVLQGGADDLGGILVDGTICPEAGAEAGLELTVRDVQRIAAGIGRPVAQRTTLYESVALPTPYQG